MSGPRWAGPHTASRPRPHCRRSTRTRRRRPGPQRQCVAAAGSDETGRDLRHRGDAKTGTAGGETTQVAVLVAPGGEVGEAGAAQIGSEGVVLGAADLDEEPAPRSQPAAGDGNDAPHDVEPVGTAIE